MNENPKHSQEGTQRTWEEVNPKAAEAMQFYARKYTVAFQAPLTAAKRIILEDALSDGVRRCRFCGRTKPEVAFRKDAHAIPEFLGNKSIFTRNECDECNQKLAHSVEDHLAKWFGPIRTVCQMPGERGFPKYKASDGSARVERGKEGLHFELIDHAAYGKVQDHLSGVGPVDLPLSMPTERYIPIAAAKCLVKVACCLAPPEDVPYLRHTISWVTSQDHSSCPLRIDPMLVQYSFTPGPMPYGDGQVFLMRRRDGVTRVPYFIVAIATANHLFATFAPFCARDDYSKGTLTLDLCFFPVPFPAKMRHGETTYHRMNWSSHEPEVNDRNFVMHIEKATRAGPDATD